ncbi:BTAD domain-containing putative transcriptional regulator [Actinoplanes sp. Pm04-4]|uniref:BTAD domain-containing putative transcriptional regulator n=1 Tax=Paractinoplanes pyxinae TaxID=2997416 RepID=A0ABT4AYF1_9ACTN|nr:BTAD domain-containing putative transcriptional regulator [Actinoplanes pyxinae]MCY1139235.1 BTAD domain-containing putative transcriptional regulator [Actinoplanes pyxinae]
MPYGVLGPTLAGPAVAAGGARVRALLARLLLDAGRVVPLPRLIDDLYGENPPAGAVNAVQSSVSRLRREVPISYDGSGYRLDVGPDEVDVHRFTRLAADGRSALRTGDFAAAASLLTEALALWRGEALADVRSAPFAVVAADRLEEQRRQAAEDRIEAELHVRPSADAEGELRTLLALAPLREHTWALLMRALAAGGRPAEALAAFEEARRVLAESLGVDPSPELQAVHTGILRGDAGPARRRLPAQLTSFVSRPELDRAREALRTARLVTLVGPGGAGKTRLSLEVAGRHPGEACLVELAGIGPDDVARSVLDALGLRDTGLRDRSAGPDTLDRLLAALSTRELLLVLDNCEHLLGAAAALAGRLLVACPGLRVLATSREPLGVTGEVRVPVAGLPIEAGVRLFAERGASAAGFALTAADEAAVRQIVRTLDGLPLALELAAARLPVLPVDELARRVGDRFRVLSRGSSTAESRHQTLWNLVAWSWDLLTPGEQSLARDFTVFRGGAGLDAIEQVCGLGAETLDVLDGLVSKSLIERDGSRYRMLSTIRAFCAAQGPASADRHASYFLQLARTADAHLRGPDQLIWLDRLDADRDNLHAAVRHGSGEVALRLVAALSFYWWLRGARGEAAALAGELLGRVGPSAPPGLAEEYLLCRLNAGPSQRDEHPARYLQTLDRPPAQPFLLYLSAFAAGPPESTDDDLMEVQESLRARLRGSPWCEALASVGSAWIGLFRGDPAWAEREFALALVSFQALGERWGMMLAQSGLAELAIARGDRQAARSPMDEALRLAAELHSDVDLAEMLRTRGDARMLGGDPDGAAADFTESMALATACGAPEVVASSRLGLARLALHQGDRAEALELARIALAECPSGWYTADGVRLSIKLVLGQAAADPQEAAHWYRQVVEEASGPDAINVVAAARAALESL